MNEAAYLGAALPERVLCLGQQLEPYSLVHEMLLRQRGNVFTLSTADFEKADPSANRIITDLLIGIFVCSQRFPEVTEALRDPELPKTAGVFRRQFDRLVKKGRVDEAEEVARFKRYVMAGEYCPPFERVKRRRGGRRQMAPRSPWLLMLFRTLAGPLHFSREEAFNCPLAEAQWLYLSHWEAEGTVRLKNKEDLDREAQDLREVRAAMEAEGLQPLRFSGPPRDEDEWEEGRNHVVLSFQTRGEQGGAA